MLCSTATKVSGPLELGSRASCLQSRSGLGIYAVELGGLTGHCGSAALGKALCFWTWEFHL